MNKFSKMMGVTALSMSLTVPALAEVSAPVNNNEQVQNELAYAFGENTDLQAKAITTQEMKDTQGAVAPLVAVGIMAGGRFIAQRYVTQSVAKSMVQSAGNNAFRQNNVWGVMANSRSQASNIAGRNNIREFHPGPGQRYTHFHTSDRNGAHVWYGRAR